MKKVVFLFSIFIICNCIVVNGQGRPSQIELEDLTQRAMNQLKIFQNNTRALAKNDIAPRNKERAIRTTLKAFSREATIQEQGKNSSRPKLYTAEKYLKAISERGEKSPIVVDFDILTKLDVDGLEEIQNADGTTTFRGKMVFKQYYCCLLYTSPSPRDATLSRMPSSA